MKNSFLEDLFEALENQEPTEDLMKEATGSGDPDLPAQKKAMDDTTGNTGAPGDPSACPVSKPDPDRDPSATDLDAQKDSSLPNAEHVPVPGDANGNPNPTAPAVQAASEMEGFSEDTLSGFKANVDLHKNRNAIPLAQETAARNPKGNTGDPATEKRSPVSPSGDTKPVALDKFIIDSYDASGHAKTPGVNGTPVSKSGDSKELPKNEFEKVADDKDGNPPSPGVNGNPDPSLESFIDACQQMKTSGTPGVVMLPEDTSLESYAMELGMGVIAMKAMEATLTAAEKRALKDSDFGLPEQRGWPLHDESHVRSAITNFHWCAQENQRELAKNILKAIRKFGIKDLKISEANPFSKYCPREWVVPRKKPERKAKAPEG